MEKSKTQLVLDKALESFRQEYRERHIAWFTNRLNGLQERLKAANFDINKTNPYPSSSQARKTYVQAVKEYNWTHGVTEEPPLGKAPYDELVTYGSSTFYSRRRGYGQNDPRYVQIKEAAWQGARDEAIKAADASIDGYIFKLCGKIGKEANEAAYAGRLWDGSVLTVVCEDGEKQVWNTKCILNCSCLGTLFNQWPTRRAS